MFFFRVTVTGESMWPRLTPGQTYWASSLLPYRVGSIVVVGTTHRMVIKFVRSIDEDQITLGGTQPSAQSITVKTEQVLGRLL
ncbi:hypothetical protein HY622_00475 [Candidatus Uhrbacteria bacterium]|nr:hypothetical protein [Candidatus Uhrbacteria bacterium]